MFNWIKALLFSAHWADTQRERERERWVPREEQEEVRNERESERERDERERRERWEERDERREEMREERREIEWDEKRCVWRELYRRFSETNKFRHFLEGKKSLRYLQCCKLVNTVHLIFPNTGWAKGQTENTCCVNRALIKLFITTRFIWLSNYSTLYSNFI